MIGGKNKSHRTLYFLFEKPFHSDISHNNKKKRSQFLFMTILALLLQTLLNYSSSKSSYEFMAVIDLYMFSHSKSCFSHYIYIYIY